MEMMKSTPKTHFIKLNNIFSIFIFIFLISFSVSICSYTHHFPNFTDSNDRHYIFLLCNGILFFLFMNFDSTHGSSLKQNQPVITNEIDHPPVLVSSAMETVAAMDEHEEEIEEREEKIKEGEKEEREEEIEEEEEENNEMEPNGNWVYVNEDHNAVSIIQIEDEMAEQHQLAVVEEQETEESEEEIEEDDEIERNLNWVYVNEDHNAVSIIHIEDQMAEQQQLGVVEEQETRESKEAAETEELNKKCAEFIRNTRDRMKCESSYRYRITPIDQNKYNNFLLE